MTGRITTLLVAPIHRGRASSYAVEFNVVFDGNKLILTLDVLKETSAGSLCSTNMIFFTQIVRLDGKLHQRPGS